MKKTPSSLINRVQVWSLLIAAPFALANHPDIPLTEDSDDDGIYDRVDLDDDNDGVLDNADFAPLNPAVQVSPMTTTTVLSSADTNLRSSNANTNYGTATSLQLRGTNRYAYFKFPVPTLAGTLSKVRLKLHSITENDLLNIVGVADSSWNEGTITWNTGPLPAAGAPVIGTIQPVPGSFASGTITALPTLGSTLTYAVYETDNSNVEEISCREAVGDVGARLEMEWYPAPELRLIASYSPTVRPNENGSGPTISFTLSEAPTANVYVPLSSSSAAAEIVDPSGAPLTLLTFTPANWNQAQQVVFRGVNDNAPNQGPRPATLELLPLHSTDAAFSGNNPSDVPFEVDTMSITNVANATLSVGDQWQRDLGASGSATLGDLAFSVLSGPAGLHIAEGSGLLSWRPLSHQIGTHYVTVRVTDSLGGIGTVSFTITVNASAIADPVGLYVTPGKGLDAVSAGTAGNPFNTIAYAFTQATPGTQIYLRGGRYTVPQTNITAAGNSSAPIVLEPLPGERVTLDCSAGICLNVTAAADWLTIRNLEIDGGAEANDHWNVIARGWWNTADVLVGCGSAIHVDGKHTLIEGCVLHDCFQKGVNIEYGRYVTLLNNVIYHIGHSSLSGGHGIMRKWDQANFGNNDPDELDASTLGGHRYRWDLDGNLIFGVEQRIYSWVITKPQSNLVLDEGKSILIDPTTDDHLSARITRNLLLWGSIDHIRLKTTPNVEVHHNSIHTNFGQGHADGLTEVAGNNFMAGMHCYKNAVSSAPGTYAYDLVTTYNSPSTNYTINQGAGFLYLNQNVAAGGGAVRNNLAGITDLGASAQIFQNPVTGNFYPGPDMPADTGVPAATLNILYQKLADYGIQLRPTGWVHDHLRNTQTILDNVPTYRFVNPSFGRATLDGEEERWSIFYNVLDPVWHGSAANAYSTFQLIIPEEYVAWFFTANPSFISTVSLHGEPADPINGFDYNGTANRKPLTTTTVTWGTRTIGGDWAPAADKKLWMTLNGTVPISQYDQLDVLEDATLAGTLHVKLTPGFTPAAGQRFVIIKASSISGSFTTLDLPPLPSGLAWTPQTTTTEYALTITSTASTPYQTWVSTSFSSTEALNSSVSGPTADPDQDGIENLMEYALGLSPTASTLLSDRIVRDLDSNQYQRLTINKNAAASDVIYAVEVSSDLVSWDSSETVVLQNTSSSLQVRDALPMSSSPRRFMRLRVTLP